MYKPAVHSDRFIITIIPIPQDDARTKMLNLHISMKIMNEKKNPKQHHSSTKSVGFSIYFLCRFPRNPLTLPKSFEAIFFPSNRIKLVAVLAKNPFYQLFSTAKLLFLEFILNQFHAEFFLISLWIPQQNLSCFSMLGFSSSWSRQLFLPAKIFVGEKKRY